jgi:hypothetical protein
MMAILFLGNVEHGKAGVELTIARRWRWYSVLVGMQDESGRSSSNGMMRERGHGRRSWRHW